LRNRPGFAGLAILTLALGIGAATTIFSVIQNVLLDPFPYIDAERVAMIQIHDLSSNRPGGRSAFQVPEFLEYQQQNHVFDEAIGGGFDDVLLKPVTGPSSSMGDTSRRTRFSFWACRHCSGVASHPRMPRRG